MGATLSVQSTATKENRNYPDSLLKLLSGDHNESNPPKVLLHSCCAPCSGAMFEEMMAMGLDVTIFFYNPNIQPRKEYEIRKEENKRYAKKHGVRFIDCDYDVDAWFKRMNGLEFEPERGIRCTACFDMRMEVTAQYASKHNFPILTTTNGTSRWKDVNQVNDSGIRAAKKYQNTNFWIYDWQNDAMTKRKYEISAKERFYKQEYVCSFFFILLQSVHTLMKNMVVRVRIFFARFEYLEKTEWNSIGSDRR